MSDVLPARVGLVMGDPCGISPELMARLLAMPETAQAALLVIGDRRVLAAGEKVAKLSLTLPLVRTAEEAMLSAGRPIFLDLGHLNPRDITMREASAKGGAFAMTNFKHGLELAKRGIVDALCFTPFNKTALRLAGNPYEDELQLAADVLGHKGSYGEFNVLEKIWRRSGTRGSPRTCRWPRSARCSASSASSRRCA
jgi:4-hydroxy-L-threonine phosphate dehydrogenase PdxA